MSKIPGKILLIIKSRDLFKYFNFYKQDGNMRKLMYSNIAKHRMLRAYKLTLLRVPVGDKFFLQCVYIKIFKHNL